MGVPAATPAIVQDLNPCELAMIAPVSICMTVHNRANDSNRYQARSTGHAAIMPFDYAGQMKTVCKLLPRLPHELNMWQVVAKDKKREFKCPVDLVKVEEVIDWYCANNPLYKELGCKKDEKRMQQYKDQHVQDGVLTIPNIADQPMNGE